ncbi:hypothetical protein BAE44_0026065 [Dichanthelium oligosanthes]|uniref:Major facilitator superfamily (MFS) profile domain-containing protein n=1 Tax=Dichanthelium oligosanthes TaxID=888268 RepID=A0A1E5UJE6_9POAL|nr:hypothetical protein BAE44_0026065 [Dichanthelium oligosanthes]
MAPPSRRGAFSNGFQLCFGLGSLTAHLVNFGTEKTEGGLVQQGEDRHNVRALLRKIRGADYKGAENELDDIVAADRSKATAWLVQVLLRTIGMGESAALLPVVIKQTVVVGPTLASMFAVDHFGRRILFLAGGAQMLVSQVLIGGIMVTQLGDQGESFLAMLCHMKAGIFFFFAAWLVVMTIFVYLLLPETKGLPIEQVERLWGHHCFVHTDESSNGEASIS